MSMADRVRWVNGMQLGGVILAVAAAAVLSYVAQFNAAVEYLDFTGWGVCLAALFPLSTDGPMLTASASLWLKAINGTPMRHAVWDWIILIVFAVLSTIFNIAHAPADSPAITIPFFGWSVEVAKLMAAVPSVALLVSFERLIARLARESVHPRSRTSALAAPDPAGLSRKMEPDDGPSSAVPDPGGLSLKMEPDDAPSSSADADRGEAEGGTVEGRPLRRSADRAPGHDRVSGQDVHGDPVFNRRVAGAPHSDAGLARPGDRPAGLPSRGARPEGAASEGDAAPVDPAGLSPRVGGLLNAAAGGALNGVLNGSVNRSMKLADALRLLRSELSAEQWLTLKRADAARELQSRYGLSFQTTSVGTGLSALRNEERRTATNGAGRG